MEDLRLVSDFEMLQSVKEVRLLHLGERLECEGLVHGRVVVVHQVWARNDVNGRQRRVEVAQRDPSLGRVHHSPMWHTHVSLVCKNLSSTTTPHTS